MIDIIIPIYNAYDELERCINSVVKHTDMDNNRLILINDYSSDHRVIPYMESLCIHNLVVLSNEKNMGFSASVNRGMQQSQENDVVLLNADTVVTERWLEKIYKCAYSDSKIGTVTPLSNNASICSVPKFNQDNVLPTNMSVDEYAELIEACSQNEYPEIPVGVGFCLYIKRELINRIGLFDADTFGRGYGEENDFCYRACKNGYRNIMCDNTFIYHSGSASFDNIQNLEKKKLIYAHQKILKNRYPELYAATEQYCFHRCNASIGNKIKYYTDKQGFQKITDETRSTIMFLSHRDFAETAKDHVGGVQFHLKDLVEFIRLQYNVLVVARNDDYLDITMYTKGTSYTGSVYIGEETNDDGNRDPEFYQLYMDIISGFGVSVIHIHHTKGLSFECFFAAKQLGIPVYFTLHDYYYMCPTINLSYCGGAYCSSEETMQCCDKCLVNNSRAGVKTKCGRLYIEKWRKICNECLAICEKVYAPSEDTAHRYKRVYPGIDIVTVAHGLQKNDMEYEKYGKKNASLRVAFVGGISKIKGGNIINQLVRKSKDNDWFIFGEIGVDKLMNYNSKNLYKNGPYRREELKGLLSQNRIDVVCIPSIWPETFCYTAMEALMVGIPVISFNFGAPSECITKYGCGWTVDIRGGWKRLLNQLSEIRLNEDDYNEKKNNTKLVVLDTVEEMTQKYICEYSKKVSAKPCQFEKMRPQYLANTMYSNNESGSIKNTNIAIRIAKKLKRIVVSFITN